MFELKYYYKFSMMLLPNHKKAYIDTEKLIFYCLNPNHIVGKHKARVFQSALGITDENYHILENSILNALKECNAQFIKKTKYGEQYIVDINIEHNNKKAMIRTAWIIKYNEDYPRLTTCYVK